ncbi:MAG: hypothetical protein KF775_08010 [Cyclobacteriaceae bacterium]|nr:hypothetical protein [Cyclobacteriaceae bacterium]
MIIERTKKEVIIRLSSKINVKDLQDLSDYLKYKELTNKFRVNQKQVDKLIASIKKGRWEKTRKKINL